MTTLNTEPDSLEQAVFVSLGAASAAWENLSGAGVFKSEEAMAAGNRLLDYINRNYVPRSHPATDVIRPEDDPLQGVLFDCD